MRAILVLFDSLNRRSLPPYGATDVVAPNFQRLARRATTFENAYVGSMPCMPARRDLHTGRYNFLHRRWGPLEPFDVSVMEHLRANGTYTHLISDHYHYWEDGGATYHNRYSSWEIVRGQEGDTWKGHVRDPKIPDHTWNRVDREDTEGPNKRQDWINRRYTYRKADHPQTRVFSLAEAFLKTNATEDNWFLQIESFDPHEPFFSPEGAEAAYPEYDFNRTHFDWPLYRQVEEPDEIAEDARMRYKTLLSYCDHSLGRILDLMDDHEMWNDTLLIVTTDHGYLLGEHGWWAKVVQPFYNEVAHVPFFVHDPRGPRAGSRSHRLTQLIDLAPTLLDFFRLDTPEAMIGIAIDPTVDRDTTARSAIIYGVFGGHVNVTDGRYVYMRAPVRSDNRPLFEYTLVPMVHGTGNAAYDKESLVGADLVRDVPWAAGYPVLRVPSTTGSALARFGTLLFDLQRDPRQVHPISSPEIEAYLVSMLRSMMARALAPTEQFERLGIEPPDRW